MGLAAAGAEPTDLQTGHQSGLDGRTRQGNKAPNAGRTEAVSSSPPGLGPRPAEIAPRSRRLSRDLGRISRRGRPSSPRGLSGEGHNFKGLVSGPTMCPAHQILSVKPSPKQKKKTRSVDR